MRKTKNMKLLQNCIDETEFTSEIYKVQRESVDPEECKCINNILFEICMYLNLLYERKENLIYEASKAIELNKRRRKKSGIFTNRCRKWGA